MLSGTINESVAGAESFETARKNAAGNRKTRRKIVEWLIQLEGWCRSGVGPLLMGDLLWTLGDGSEGLLGWPGREFPQSCLHPSLNEVGKAVETRWSTRPKQLETLQTTNVRAEAEEGLRLGGTSVLFSLSVCPSVRLTWNLGASGETRTSRQAGGVAWR